MTWLQEAEERCEKATSPPWKEDGASSDAGGWFATGPFHDGKNKTMDEAGRAGDQADADQEFVDHAREDLPRALALIRSQAEALRVARHEMEQLVRQVQEFATWDELDWPMAFSALNDHAASQMKAIATLDALDTETKGGKP